MEQKETFYGHLFLTLLLADLKVFKSIIIDRAIDTFIWVAALLTSSMYILPAIGISKTFGLLTFSGIVASGGIMAVYTNVATMVSDIEDNATLSYQLILPLPAHLVFIKYITYFAITSTCYNALVLPFGKLLLWNAFPFHSIQPGKLCLIILLSNIFLGAFTLLLIATTPAMKNLSNVWMRILFPLWFLGGFQFSWHALQLALPFLAYIDLANPFIYIFDGTRAAMLGQAGYLNFWICCGALIVATLLCGIFAFLKLKQRLDFV